MDVDGSAASSSSSGENVTREQYTEQKKHLQETLVRNVDDKLQEVVEDRATAPAVLTELMNAIAETQQQKYRGQQLEGADGLNAELLMAMAQQLMGQGDENTAQAQHAAGQLQQATESHEKVTGEVQLLEGLLKSANRQLSGRR